MNSHDIGRVWHRFRLLTATVAASLLVAVPVTGNGAIDVLGWNAQLMNAIAASAQLGPVHTRTLAMAHAAMHDALNAIEPRYEHHAFTGPAGAAASPEAAIAAAAHDVMASVVPDSGTAAQQAAAMLIVSAAYAEALAAVPEGSAKADGIAIGQAAAVSIVSQRCCDGALGANIPYVLVPGPGFWRPTPNPVPPDPLSGGVGLTPPMLPAWGDVTPFTLNANEQFRPDGPPPLWSDEYAADYNEVKAIGARLSATRTAEQSTIARFWYEGSAFGWNRIARTVAAPRSLDSVATGTVVRPRQLRHG
jgi:hypothetical protein